MKPMNLKPSTNNKNEELDLRHESLILSEKLSKNSRLKISSVDINEVFENAEKMASKSTLPR
jgi:hypothetical protein